MPLPAATPREPIHTRRIECQGFLRQDGLWDIEGRLTDGKTYSFKNEYRGEVKVGDQTGTQIFSTDAQTGQIVVFVGVTSQDKHVLMVFRWTAPGLLKEATRPVFDSILGSVRFGPITSSQPLPAAPIAKPSPAATR